MSDLPTSADIDARRQRLGLSLPDLAKRAGIAQTTLWRLLSGRSGGRYDTVTAVVSVLDEVEETARGA